MNLLSVWLWEARAWTEPQSALSQWWLEIQGALVVLIPAALIFFVLCLRRKA